jgi:uncharacterized protein (TIGR00369 family)
MGTEILGSDGDGIEVAYEARADFTNRIGTVAGGMLASMLDSLTGLAALAVLPPEEMAVHTALKIEYRRPASPGRLVGHAKVVARSGRDLESSGELRDSEGRVVARGEATLRVIPRR